MHDVGKEEHAMMRLPPYDAGALALMEKVELFCGEYSAKELEPQGCRIRAVMKDGKVITKERKTFDPLSPEKVEQKFLYTASKHFGSEKAERILQMCRDLTGVGDIADFTKLFR